MDRPDPAVQFRARDLPALRSETAAILARSDPPGPPGDFDAPRLFISLLRRAAVNVTRRQYWERRVAA